MKFRSLLLIGLAITLGSAQAFGQRRLLEDEENTNPYLPNLLGTTSPGTVVHHAQFTSVQVNVNSIGQNIVGDAANEPSLSIDPTNPNRMVIAWRQFDNVASNFRQGGWAYTSDGGQHWTFPGNLQPGTFRSDPVLQSDLNGNFHYLSLLETFFDDTWLSTNGGQTFNRVASAFGGDKEWFVLDRTNSIGKGNMYQIWSTAGNNFNGNQFTRSTDGGVTWTNPSMLPNQPVWGILDVNLNGDLFICGSDGGSNFYMDRSTNAKNSAVNPTFDLASTFSLGGDVGFGQNINPDGLSGQSWIGVDRSNTPFVNNLYVLSSVSVNTNNPLDVHFVRSTNAGQTWSAPVRINDDPLNGKRYHWMATMTVAPNGRIDVVWNDTRNDATNHTSQLFYTCSLDGGTTWLPNTQVSPAWNQSLGYPNQNKMGDYLGVVSDNAAANVAYCATFNGEEDVYYLRIPAPIRVNPDTFVLARGRLVSGGVGDLAWSDNSYLVAGQGITVGAQDPPVQCVVTGTSTIANPTALRFRLEASVNSISLGQSIALLNQLTGQYETVDARAATTSDSVVNVVATGNLSRFVNQTTGAVQAKISYIATGPTSQTWQAKIDQTQWTISP